MQILRKLAPQLPLHSLLAPLAPLGFKKKIVRFLASISAQIWRNITKSTKNLDFKKTVPLVAPPFTHPPGPPWEPNIFLGCFWHLSKLKFEEILPKISRMQVLRKLSPLWPPDYYPPWLSWESEIFLGGFWHLSKLKFEEISPKIPRMQILRKLAPLLPLVY